MTKGSLHQLKVSKNAQLTKNSNGTILLVFQVKNATNLSGNQLLKIVNSKNNTNSLQFDVENKENLGHNELLQSEEYTAPGSNVLRANHLRSINKNTLATENAISSMNTLARENAIPSMNTSAKQFSNINLEFINSGLKPKEEIESNELIVLQEKYNKARNNGAISMNNYINLKKNLNQKRKNQSATKELKLSNTYLEEVVVNKAHIGISPKRFTKKMVDRTTLDLNIIKKEINGIINSNNPIYERNNNQNHTKYGGPKSKLLNNIIVRAKVGIRDNKISKNDYKLIVNAVKNAKTRLNIVGQGNYEINEPTLMSSNKVNEPDLISFNQAKKHLHNKNGQLINLGNFENDAKVLNNKRIIRGKYLQRYGLGSTNEEINNILSSNNPLNERENNVDHSKYGRSKSSLLNNMIKKANKGLSGKYISSNQYSLIKEKVNHAKKKIHGQEVMNW